ncbi:exodeoxyribonuclease V subunit gamma [Comamonas thiooxydans]|uniref:exodeoxyribonuclease V subunit gamma n=1 Tax=Comamonas thiooxydans TaxID=363952 RepID=UPI001CCAFE51|nr:exodeoxyribonuclease V subunit gamma [Comamonas thiooxydans]UBQ42291.1 exodeoxyribonuclease V subunit gamma [Comamonas thiooxydans]
MTAEQQSRASQSAANWQPGLIAIHGNQTEALADTVLAWLAAHPLQALEPEIVLVQSNGMAEWFKMRMAEQQGVCAAAQVELPARFVWRSYRQILGRHEVPRESPLDKTPMIWRLMRLLPQCLGEPAFAPIANFLRPGEPQRLLQLAEKLADLFDQYQIYRADWLAAWEQGEDVLRTAGRPDVPVPEGQLWQPQLWRKVLAELNEQERAATRPALLARILDALQSGQPPVTPLARRVVVFGMSQMPLSLMQFLSGIAQHSQVLIAVPNPCRFHWADAIDGRELLRQQRRRHADKGGKDLAQIPLAAMHAHAHPLLAAWGRQSRDYVRQLDAFDTTGDTAVQWGWPRVDVYDEADAGELIDAPLLAQVQQRIRDLVPMSEHPAVEIAAADQSIVFHKAHGLVRELEVLHDQLLQWLAEPAAAGRAALAPREVVVMLPSIEEAAPAIRAVFGQYGRHDARHIPFDIADVGARASSPLVTALQWLLKLPQQRCRLSELCDLLDVPAVAARVGLEADDLPQLTHWMAGAGIRWGLNHAQRAQLGLAACGDPNSAWFGLRRMLLGYASGPALEAAFDEAQAFAGMEPYDEVGGLTAELAGSLASLLGRMLQWWQTAATAAAPEVWAQRFRSLMDDFFVAQGDEDQALCAALDTALVGWQAACEQAGFDALIPLEVAQEAWLQALSEPALNQRFRAGGVTFCTLMPMRAIPFEVVCLLGMNDGDYPRRATRVDFDLMALPGQQRPGDRARRDDDRQLMLDALLSARSKLYISWAGRHVRDNSEQPPSVLVSQLRDYLRQGWQGEGSSGLSASERGDLLLAQRTRQHPLQPFSRRYFEQASGLSTFAREWYGAHEEREAQALPVVAAFEPDPEVPLTLTRLTEFLRHPARSFLRNRLQVRFEQDEDLVEDDEIFSVDGLTAYGLIQQLQQGVRTQLAHDAALDVGMQVQRQVQRLGRAGVLPLAGLGRREAEALQAQATPSLLAWQQQMRLWPHAAPRERLLLHSDAVTLDDWMDGLQEREEPSSDAGHSSCWFALEPRTLLNKKGELQAHKLLPIYVRSLALSSRGSDTLMGVIARDTLVWVQPLEPAAATQRLQALMQLWLAGQNEPLPLPLKAAIAAGRDDPSAAAQAYEGGYMLGGECEDPSWARCYPDWEVLTADLRFHVLAKQVYGPLHDWLAAQVQTEDLPLMQCADQDEQPGEPA